MKQVEHQEQAALFEWVALQTKRWPELENIFAIPNGGYRHKTVAAKLQAEGVRAGVPDIFLAVSRAQWHGLFIEMKAGRNRPTPAQQEWIARLNRAGYAAVVCYGWLAARQIIEEYLKADENR